MLFLVSYRLDDTCGNPYAPEEVIPTIILMVMGSSIFGHKYSSVHDPRLRLIIWLNDQTTSGLNPFNPINMIPGLKSISLPFFPNYRDLNEVPIYHAIPVYVNYFIHENFHLVFKSLNRT